jgi:hypothetical protein
MGKFTVCLASLLSKLFKYNNPEKKIGARLDIGITELDTR